MKKVVYLQVYVGKKLLFEENGKVTNQNQEVTLTYPTQEWDNYMKHLPSSGFCKVEVTKVLDEIVEAGQYSYKLCEDFEELKSIVSKHLNNKVKKPLTKEQKEIAELKAQMAEILGKKNEKPTVKEIETVQVEAVGGIDGDLEDLKAQYKVQEGKEVPNNKKNDKKWIENKLTK